MEFSILVPTIEDAEKVYEVFKQTWLDTYINQEYDITREDILSKYPEEEREATIEKYKSFYNSLNSNPESAHTLVWVAKEGENVYGVVTINKENPLEIGALYVLPQYQGKGIGKALMNFILEQIGKGKSAQLKAAKYNDRAIRFYEKFGFKNIGEVNDDNGKLPSGKIIPEIRMTNA